MGKLAPLPMRLRDCSPQAVAVTAVVASALWQFVPLISVKAPAPWLAITLAIPYLIFFSVYLIGLFALLFKVLNLALAKSYLKSVMVFLAWFLMLVSSLVGSLISLYDIEATYKFEHWKSAVFFLLIRPAASIVEVFPPQTLELNGTLLFHKRRCCGFRACSALIVIDRTHELSLPRAARSDHWKVANASEFWDAGELNQADSLRLSEDVYSVVPCIG